MNLNRKGRLVRFSYALSDWGPPEQTSLCRFFWRTFVFMPMFWLFVAFAVGGVLFVIVDFIWGHVVLTAVGAGVTAAAFAIYTYLATHYTLLPMKVNIVREKVRESVFMQGLKTVKGKVCPIIYIK